MTRGVVYVAVRIGGGKYLNEVTQSARSVKACSPGLPITLYTDDPQRVDSLVFDDIRYIDSPPSQKELGAKIVAVSKAPYDECLFLDADTYVCAGLLEMFEVLKHYDIAMAPAPRRAEPTGVKAYGEVLPDWFPEVNTGVILFRKSAAMASLVKRWSRTYTSLGKWNDQMAMRGALYHEIMERGLRFYQLLPEYNCRAIMLQFIGSRVHIIHGRGQDLGKVCKQINSRIGARIWMPKHGLFRWKDWERVDETR